MNNEFQRMQKLAGLITENEESTNSPKFKVGQTLNSPEGGTMKILKISSYFDHQDEIDDQLEEEGWEEDYPGQKEEVMWYFCKNDNGKKIWWSESEID